MQVLSTATTGRKLRKQFFQTHNNIVSIHENLLSDTILENTAHKLNWRAVEQGQNPAEHRFYSLRNNMFKFIVTNLKLRLLSVKLNLKKNFLVHRVKREVEKLHSQHHPQHLRVFARSFCLFEPHFTSKPTYLPGPAACFDQSAEQLHWGDETKGMRDEWEGEREGGWGGGGRVCMCLRV